jgi:hypothetical protein
METTPPVMTDLGPEGLKASGFEHRYRPLDEFDGGALSVEHTNH